jgi:hypothetical protein
MGDDFPCGQPANKSLAKSKAKALLKHSTRALANT